MLDKVWKATKNLFHKGKEARYKNRIKFHPFGKIKCARAYLETEGRREGGHERTSKQIIV